MPYNKPRKTKEGWVLPKKAGGLHKSRGGKVVHFTSKANAQHAANAIMASEHGFIFTKRKKK